MLSPISTLQQQEVLQKTRSFISQGCEHYGLEYKPVDVAFDLSGRTAGMFCVSGRRVLIRYNPWIFAKYYAENLSGTVPHEVAHYIVWRLCGFSKKIKPHGVEWQAVMDVFGADKTVTCDFDFSGVPQRRQQRYFYDCNCQEHQVTATVHNRIQRRRYAYHCKHCGVKLRKRRVNAQATVKDRPRIEFEARQQSLFDLEV